MRARGSTLIEMMIVVAVLGILAALAVPNLAPIIHDARLKAASSGVAGLVERARRLARSDSRCYRVLHEGPASRAVRLQRHTGSQCVNLDGAAWTDVERFEAEGTRLTLRVRTIGGGSIEHFVLRPNGRLRGDGDLDVGPRDDGVEVVVEYGHHRRWRKLFVQSNGRLCEASGMTPVPATPASIACGLVSNGGGS